MVDLSQPLEPHTFRTQPFRDARPQLQDPQALRELANHEGYLYLPGLIDAASVVALRRLVHDFACSCGLLQRMTDTDVLRVVPGARLEGRGWDDPRFVELQRHLASAPEFIAVAQHPALVEVIATVANQPMWLATANYCWLKLPGSPAQTTRPHQDAYYLPQAPGLWTAWVPVVDTPIPLGPLGILRDSHRRDWPHVDAWTGIDLDPTAPDVCWATQAAHAGDVVLFQARTVHCAWSNMSQDLVRASLDLRFEPQPNEGTTALRPMR